MTEREGFNRGFVVGFLCGTATLALGIVLLGCQPAAPVVPARSVGLLQQAGCPPPPAGGIWVQTLNGACILGPWYYCVRACGRRHPLWAPSPAACGCDQLTGGGGGREEEEGQADEGRQRPLGRRVDGVT